MVFRVTVAWRFHAALTGGQLRRGLCDGQRNGLMGGGINPGDAGSLQTPHRPALTPGPVRGEIRGVAAVFRDEHGVDTQNATAIQGLLVLRLQDQQTVHTNSDSIPQQCGFNPTKGRRKEYVFREMDGQAVGFRLYGNWTEYVSVAPRAPVSGPMTGGYGPRSDRTRSGW